MNNNAIQSAYQRYAKMYDFAFGNILRRGRLVSVDLLGIQPKDHVLEVGVGTGLTLPFFPKHCEITGIDVSVPMLKKAEKNIASYGMKNVKIIEMDAMNLDFPDNHFDRIIAAYVISVVPDSIKVLKEMSRVCKPGGKIVFINHFKSKNKIVAAFEKLLSLISSYFGFSTTTELDLLLEQIPELTVKRILGVNLFKYWKAVETINEKR